MTVEIANTLDVTDRVIEEGKEDSDFSPGVFTVASRTVRLADSDGFLAPQAGGQLDPDNLGWKNQRFTITNNSGKVTFSGLILDCKTVYESGATYVDVEALSTLGALLPFGAIVNNKIIATVDGNHGTGAKTIKVGSTDAAKWVGLAVFSPNQDLNPSYAILEKDEFGNLKLDRGLESELSDGDEIIVSVAKVDSPTAILADVLRQVLTIVNRPDDLDEASVNTQINFERQNNLQAYVFVNSFDGVTVGDLVQRFLQAFNLYISQSDEGLLSIVSGPAYRGNHPRQRITDDLIVNITESFNAANNGNPHYYAYECAYLPIDSGEGNAAALKTTSRQLADSDLYPYFPKDLFAPFPLSNLGGLGGNTVLYYGEVTARYYGELNLDYFQVNRKRHALVILPENADGNQLTIQQFSTILLDQVTLDNGKQLNNVPAFVVSAYFDDEENLFTEVIVELNNEVFPNLPTPTAL